MWAFNCALICFVLMGVKIHFEIPAGRAAEYSDIRDPKQHQHFEYQTYIFFFPAQEH